MCCLSLIGYTLLLEAQKQKKTSCNKELIVETSQLKLLGSLNGV